MGTATEPRIGKMTARRNECGWYCILSWYGVGWVVMPGMYGGLNMNNCPLGNLSLYCCCCYSLLNGPSPLCIIQPYYVVDLRDVVKAGSHNNAVAPRRRWCVWILALCQRTPDGGNLKVSLSAWLFECDWRMYERLPSKMKFI